MDKQRQDKKDQFTESKNKGSGSKFIALIAVVAVAAIVGAFIVLQGPTDGIASVKSIAGEVRLEMNQISDGQAHYFKYATDKGTISFFVIKSVDGVMRTAFDACDVCYHEKKGYRQEGNMMVCNNCNMQFRSDLINEVKGGCNPAPLQRRIEGTQLVIAEKDLLGGAWYFGG